VSVQYLRVSIDGVLVIDHILSFRVSLALAWKALIGRCCVGAAIPFPVSATSGKLLRLAWIVGWSAK